MPSEHITAEQVQTGSRSLHFHRHKSVFLHLTLAQTVSAFQLKLGPCTQFKKHESRLNISTCAERQQHKENVLSGNAQLQMKQTYSGGCDASPCTWSLCTGPALLLWQVLVQVLYTHTHTLSLSDTHSHRYRQPGLYGGAAGLCEQE